MFFLYQIDYKNILYATKKGNAIKIYFLFSLVTDKCNDQSERSCAGNPSTNQRPISIQVTLRPKMT